MHPVNRCHGVLYICIFHMMSHFEEARCVVIAVVCGGAGSGVSSCGSDRGGGG